MLLGSSQIWCPHTEPYKSLLDILANRSSAENRTDLRLRQVVYLSIFYTISNSWLQEFNGFDFSFRWLDIENHQYIQLVRFTALNACLYSLEWDTGDGEFSSNVRKEAPLVGSGYPVSLYFFLYIAHIPLIVWSRIPIMMIPVTSWYDDLMILVTYSPKP